jgi:hypothetical protein
MMSFGALIKGTHRNCRRSLRTVAEGSHATATTPAEARLPSAFGHGAVRRGGGFTNSGSEA